MQGAAFAQPGSPGTLKPSQAREQMWGTLGKGEPSGSRLQASRQLLELSRGRLSPLLPHHQPGPTQARCQPCHGVGPGADLDPFSSKGSLRVPGPEQARLRHSPTQLSQMLQ